jgi:CheY-like chemotaxis protein
VKEFTPDVAILDIGLPVMDGYELAARLRAAMAKQPRLIALSGYGQSADKARSTAAGFERHLVKPVDLKSLLDMIAG